MHVFLLRERRDLLQLRYRLLAQHLGSEFLMAISGVHIFRYQLQQCVLRYYRLDIALHNRRYLRVNRWLCLFLHRPTAHRQELLLAFVAFLFEI